MEFDKRVIGAAVFVTLLVVGLVVFLTTGSAGESTDVDAGACNCDGGVDVVGDGGVAAVESVVTDETAEVVPAATETVTVTTDPVVTAGSEVTVTVTAPDVTETATTGTTVTATTPR